VVVDGDNDRESRRPYRRIVLGRYFNFELRHDPARMGGLVLINAPHDEGSMRVTTKSINRCGGDETGCPPIGAESRARDFNSISVSLDAR
jgi:hypothetical protein